MANMEYPLTTVVQKILNSPCGNQGGNDNRLAVATKRFMAYSYQRDFKKLWGLDRGEGGLGKAAEFVIKNCEDVWGNTEELTLVVIWDGMPESDGSPMNIGNYVTPYDWAVMFSYWLFKLAADKPKMPHVRIFILDLKSQEHGESFGVSKLKVLNSSFPWIQIYRPVGKETLKTDAVDVTDAHARAALPLGCLGFDHFISDVQNLSRTLSTFHDDDDVDRLDHLETAIQLWAANLLKPGDRHTVANFIGPVILAHGFARGADIVGEIAGTSPLRGALIELILATDMVAMNKHSYTGSELLPCKKGEDRFGRKGKLKFVLVDDQYEGGFHHVLSRLIWGNLYQPNSAMATQTEWTYNAPFLNSGLKCYNGAVAILEKIVADGRIADWDQPRHFKLPFDGDILLLDLRLWIEKDTKKKFLGSLKNVCDVLKVGQLLKDPHFKRAYEAIQNEDTPDETATLVFLPLLLSYYDPSLPIVLFSSTHQRAVIEMVSHRPNIITDFSKPLLGNYVQAQDCGEILRDLRKALEKAIELHEARVVWERIVAISAVAPVFFNFYKVNEKKHYEIYNVPPCEENIFKYGKFGLFKGIKGYATSADEIRKSLSEFYQQYVLRQASFDLLTYPWELIESNLTQNEDDLFDAIDLKKLNLYPKNGGGIVLKQLRNKKAHGDKITRRGAMDSRQWRWLGIIEFLMFLDFLAQDGDQDANLPLLNDAQLNELERLPNMHAILDRLEQQNSLLRYSVFLALIIWRDVPQSFSASTKDVLRAFSPTM